METDQLYDFQKEMIERVEKIKPFIDIDLAKTKSLPTSNEVFKGCMMELIKGSNAYINSLKGIK